MYYDNTIILYYKIGPDYPAKIQSDILSSNGYCHFFDFVKKQACRRSIRGGLCTGD